MDEEAPQVPPFLGYFDVSATGFAWREPRPEQIERRRAAMDDVLIFDVLLTSGGIHQPVELFPPHDVDDLVRLLEAIDGSHYDILKRECLVYWLLKWHQDGREERFRNDRCLPPQFTALADAYWHLDTGVNVARAVGILSDARLNTDYASKIIHAISLSPDSSHLIINYVRTAKPLLVEPVDIDLYALALAGTSLLEAWQFQRTFNETDRTRSRLLEKLLEWSISPQLRPSALSALLAFPLSPFEEDFLHNYALEPPKSLTASSISILRDLVCVRLIQSGKYAAAIKIDHQFASSTLNESKADSNDRRKMVRDLYNALPAVERMLLDTELGGLALGNKPSTAKPQLDGSSLVLPTTSADITMSWEDIPRPNGTPAATPLHDIIPAAPVIPIPERSGAPRFGGPIPPLRESTSAPAAIAAAPLIPISTPTGRGLNNSGPRKSFPLSTTSVPFASPGSKLPASKSSFTQTTQLFLSGSGGSVGSALKFPSIPQPGTPPVAAPFPSTSNGIGQAPASRKQNAFYNPPPMKQGSAGTKRAFEVVEEPAEPVRDVEMDEDEEEATRDGEGEDRELNVRKGRMGGEKKRRSRRREVDEAQDEGDGFRYSVFGNGNGAHVQPAPGHKGIAPVTEKRTRRLPPGAFTSDEEEEAQEDEDEEIPPPPPPLSRGTRSTRQSARTAATTAAPAPPQPAKTTRRSTKPSKDKDLGRSLPGSLILDHEADEGEDEEDDYVAPLRQPSPVHRRLVRKSRASTPSDIGDGDGAEGGVQTRRRSSRLSSAHGPSASPEPPSPAKKKEAKGRKSAASAVKKSAATSTRKRR